MERGGSQLTVTGFCGVALAAGRGARMAPLTRECPKPLLTVGHRTLVDRALDRLAEEGLDSAVNAHHRADVLAEHLAGRDVHISVEGDEERGTAGALGVLRPWIDGRATVVVNGDTWCPGGVATLLADWDTERIRILVPAGGSFGPKMTVLGALMPWSDVAALGTEPTGLWEVSWRAAHAAGRIEVVTHSGPYQDCSTPADLWAANMAWSGGRSVMAERSPAPGTLERVVVLPGGRVAEGEVLVDAVRSRQCTVLVRDRPDPTGPRHGTRPR